MKLPRLGVDVRTALLYALLGGVWILFSDRLLLSLSLDPAALTRAQTYKGWIFVLGSALFIFTLVRADLLRRNSAEAALRESEERFRSITERTSDVIYIRDEQYRIIYVSPSVTRVLGYQPEEILAGREALDFIRPQSMPAVLAARERFLAGAVSNFESVEACFKRRDGTWAWLDLEATPIRMDGRFKGVQVVGRDVTERKRAEEALRESERELARIFQANPAGIAISKVDDGRFVECNEAFERFTGYRRDEVIGRTGAEVGLGFEPELEAELNRALAADGRVRNLEFRVHNRGGAECVGLMSAERIELGGAPHTLFMAVDITERKQAQEAQRQSDRSYREIFNAATDAIFVHDAETGAILDVNDTMLRLFGVERAEAIGLVPDMASQGVSPYSEAEAQQWLTKAVAEGPQVFEWRARKKSGELLWVEVALKVAEIGGRRRVLALVRDIGERKRAAEALQEKHEEMERFFALTLDLMCIADTDGRFLRLNRSWERTLGYGLDELEGRRLLEFVHPDDVQPTLQAMAALSAGQDVIDFINRCRCRDGGYRWIEWRSTPYRGGLIYAAARDITERRRVEADLRRADTFSRAILDTSDALIVVLDRQGRVVLFNPACERFTGWRAEEIVGREIWDTLIPDEQRADVRAVFDQLTAGTFPVRHENDWLARDGSRRWITWANSALPNEAGEIEYVVGTGVDITRRRRAEAAVRHSEERLSATIQTTPHVAVQWYDERGRVLFWNRAAEHVFGWKAEEAVGRTLDQLTLAPQEAVGFVAMLQQIARTGEPVGPVELNFRRRDGSEGTCLSTTFTLPSSGEGASCFVRMDVDITERKRAEHQLILQRDLGLALGDSRDLAETLRLCTEAGLAASGLDCGGVYLQSPATGRFELRHHHGCSEVFVQSASGFALDTPLVRLILAGQPVYTHFRDLDLPAAKAGASEGLRAVAIIPLRHKSRVFGSLHLSSRVHDSVPEFARVALETIAGQIGQAVARDRMLQSLHDSERSYREIFNGADDAIFVHNPSTGAIVDANDSMRSLYGFGDEDLSGLSLDDVSLGASPYSAAEGVQLLAKAAAEGPQRFEWRARKKGGELFWVEVSLKSAEIGGQPRLLALVRDITHRKQAEAALARERLFTDAVLDSVPGLLYLYDEDGHLVRWNKRHEEMTGYSGEELAGRYLLDWFEGESKALIAQGILRGSRGGRTDVEASLKTKHGQLIPLLFTAVPLVIDGRQYVTGIGLDVTERKRAEEELNRHREELAHVGRALTLGELSSSIAHELNQPLTAILSNAQAARRFLDRDPADLAEVRQALTDIEHADRHAGDVIRRLRDFIGRKQAARELVDLNQVSREVLRLVRAEAASRDVMTIAQLTLDLPLVRGDRIALQQVLLNLVVNALDAVQQVPATERQVAVRSRREEGGTVAVTVSDTGPGLAPELHEKLFEPFFTTKADGLGLGLSLSRSLVEAHGGQVWAASHPEGGMIFGFRLPIATGGTS